MAIITPVRKYKVLVTPLVDKNEYGSVIDITQDIDMSDFIKDGGIGKIKRELDNGDYDIGVFAYGSITLKALNIDGKFNDETDYRSIFKFSRDKAKVKIVFTDVDGDTEISFEGIINEEGTRQDFIKDEVKFKVLSYDSVIRKTKVAGGLVSSGSLFSTAIKSILNVPDITALLTYSASDINVDIDLIIDDHTWFDNKTTKEALNALLVASNSVMTIENNVMIVRTRAENSGNVFSFYGHGDVFGRENIINIKAYNTGLHRTFNSVVVNDREKGDQILIEAYGVRQKETNIDFMTDIQKIDQISENILNNFKYPKIEMELETTTEVAKDLNLLDLVSIDYPFRTTPSVGDSLPMYGVAKYGESNYPRTQGNMRIHPNTAFKVVGIQEDPKKFTTSIKLRQRGININDGVFSSFVSLYGLATYGESTYQDDPDYINPNIVANYGAAIYNLTLYRN